MTDEGLMFIGWAAVIMLQVSASILLHRRLGMLVASQGGTAAVSAWAFALCWQTGWGAWSVAAAILTGAVIGLLHLLIYWLAGRDVLLVVSVLISFFVNDLWLALPAITGGSGGLALVGASQLLMLLPLAAGGSIATWNDFGWRQLRGVAGPALRGLGLDAGVLGVPAGRVITLTFAASGAAMGCAGAAAGMLAGVVHPSLFPMSWSLTIVAIVITPWVGPLVNLICLPLLFIVVRSVLRDLAPVSVGYSQLIEMAFPVILVTWSRLANQLGDIPTDVSIDAAETTTKRS